MDASYDLYLGPDKPDDVPEANGLRTNPGEGYLLNIRLYAPTEPFYDQSWILDDVAKISWAPTRRTDSTLSGSTGMPRPARSGSVDLVGVLELCWPRG